ncbi:hypothetical protein D3C80_2105670 [compost metagenome]
MNSGRLTMSLVSERSQMDAGTVPPKYWLSTSLSWRTAVDLENDEMFSLSTRTWKLM